MRFRACRNDLSCSFGAAKLGGAGAGKTLSDLVEFRLSASLDWHVSIKFQHDGYMMSVSSWMLEMETLKSTKEWPCCGV